MNYTDDQLKKALAKMLPEEVKLKFNNHYFTEYLWNAKQGRMVYDTELPYLCSLVEATLDTHDGSHTTPIGELWECKYDRLLTTNIKSVFTWKATWQQRVIALAKVKGIEIV